MLGQIVLETYRSFLNVPRLMFQALAKMFQGRHILCLFFDGGTKVSITDYQSIFYLYSMVKVQSTAVIAKEYTEYIESVTQASP